MRMKMKIKMKMRMKKNGNKIDDNVDNYFNIIDKTKSFKDQIETLKKNR